MNAEKKTILEAANQGDEGWERVNTNLDTDGQRIQTVGNVGSALDQRSI
jgi:hypothetical protein